MNKCLEDCIRRRSIALWEHDGRPEGRDADYLRRARVEIEEELRAAFDGKDNGFVPPRLDISQRPVRHA